MQMPPNLNIPNPLATISGLEAAFWQRVNDKISIALGFAPSTTKFYVTLQSGSTVYIDPERQRVTQTVIYNRPITLPGC